jgi:4-aminobutyrate aminotransferase
LATLDLVEHELADNAALVGTHLIGRLGELAATQPLMGQVRGRGLMIGIDLPNHDTASAVEFACFEQGLLVLTCGERSVRMAPPLVVTTQQADTAVELFSQALDQVGAAK